MNTIRKHGLAPNAVSPASANFVNLGATQRAGPLRRLRWLAALGLSAAVAGCGGGAGSSSPAEVPGVDQQLSPTEQPPEPRAVVRYSVLARGQSDIALVALQDGDGAWQRIEPSSLATSPGGFLVVDYQLPVTATDLRFGAVVVCNHGGRFHGDLIQSQADALAQRTISCIGGRPSLAGSVTNADVTGVTVYLGGASASPPLGAADYTVAPPAVPGRHTLAARDGSNPRRFYIDRTVDIAADSSALPPIDFAYALPADASTYTLGVTGLPNPDFSCELRPELRVGSTFVDLSQGAIRYPTGSDPEVDWQPVDQTQRQADDRFRLQTVCGHIGDPADRTDERGIATYRMSPTTSRLLLPAGLPAPSLDMSDQRLRIGIQPYSPLRLGLAVRTYHLHLDDRISAERGVWNVRLDQAWLGSGTEYTFPDLSALAGWDERYYPVARDPATYAYGTDHVTHFTAYASEGPNIWNLIEGYNNGLAPSTEGTVYWARRLLR